MATLAGYVVHHKIRWPNGTIVVYHEFVVIQTNANLTCILINVPPKTYETTTLTES